MRLIDADAEINKLKQTIIEHKTAGTDDDCTNKIINYFIKEIENAPTIDAVPIEVLRSWLYEVAMNNTDNYLSDACEEIISRFRGLIVFAKEKMDEVI